MKNAYRNLFVSINVDLTYVYYQMFDPFFTHWSVVSFFLYFNLRFSFSSLFFLSFFILFFVSNIRFLLSICRRILFQSVLLYLVYNFFPFFIDSVLRIFIFIQNLNHTYIYGFSLLFHSITLIKFDFFFEEITIKWRMK